MERSSGVKDKMAKIKVHLIATYYELNVYAFLPKSLLLSILVNVTLECDMQVSRQYWDLLYTLSELANL